jgi:hypothetical protein
LLYVDDLVLASNSDKAMQKFKQKLQNEFKVKILGKLHCFLNIEIIRDRENRKIWLRQKQYIEGILQQMGVADCNPAHTPEITNSHLHSGMCPDSDAERNFMSKIPYRAAVGSLIYLATKKRPDIAHAVQQVAQFCENPGRLHWNAIKHIFRYLKHTGDYGILYQGDSKCLNAYFGQGATNCPPGAIFADSDWANDPDKRNSVGGYVFMMHGGVIDYNCKKFTNTPLSSTEAEWYAACEAAKSGKWIRKILTELEYPIDGPLIIFEDNQGCVSYGKRRLNQSSMKHIDLKYHFLREEIANLTLELQRVPSADNIADVFTKALAKPTFQKFRDGLNVQSIPRKNL